MKTNLLLIISCLLLLSSACSVNKRVHRPGYNVEWHSANPKPEKQPLEKLEQTNERSSSKQVDEGNTILEEEIEIEESSDTTRTIQEERAIAGGEANIGILENVYSISKDRVQVQENQLNKQFISARRTDYTNKTKNLVIWGFAIGITSSLMITLMFILAMNFIIDGFLAIIIFGSLAIVFGIISITKCKKAIRQIRMETEDFQSRGLYKTLAISGMILSIVSIAVGLFFLISIPFYLG